MQSRYLLLVLVALVALSAVEGKRSSKSREIKNQAAKARRSQGVLAFYRMQIFFFRVTIGVSGKVEFKEMKISIRIQRKTFLITKTRALEGEGGEAMAAATLVILELKTEVKIKELRDPTSDVTKELLANCSDTIATTSTVIASIDFATEIVMTAKVQARFDKLVAKGKCMTFASLQTSITTTLTISSTIAIGVSTGESITIILETITEYMLIITEISSGGGSSGSGSSSGSGESGLVFAVGEIEITVVWSEAGVDCDESCLSVGELCNFTYFADVFNDTANVDALLVALETPELETCLLDSANDTDAAPCQSSDGSCNLGLDAEPACAAADITTEVSRLCFCSVGANCKQHGKGKGHEKSGGKGKGGTVTCGSSGSSGSSGDSSGSK